MYRIVLTKTTREQRLRHIINFQRYFDYGLKVMCFYKNWGTGPILRVWKSYQNNMACCKLTFANFGGIFISDLWFILCNICVETHRPEGKVTGQFTVQWIRPLRLNLSGWIWRYTHPIPDAVRAQKVENRRISYKKMRTVKHRCTKTDSCHGICSFMAQKIWWDCHNKIHRTW